MGLGNFLGKVWGGVKNAASATWEGTKKVGRAVGTGIKKVGRAVRPVVDFAQKAAGLAEHIPGFIGDIAGSVRKGIDTFNEWVDLVPDSKMKDKLKEASSGAGELVDKGEEWARQKADTVQGYANQARPWIDAADNIADKMEGGNRSGNKRNGNSNYR